MVNSISLNAHNYSGIVSGSSGKLYVPVSPNSVIYSHFDHISGVAAKANQTQANNESSEASDDKKDNVVDAEYEEK